MSKYRMFLILIFPMTLMVVTMIWFTERPRFTWKEMFKNCWEASWTKIN